MSTQEKLINELNLDLKTSVVKYFDSIEMFENQYILNSSITKGTSFENSTFCSHFTLYDADKILFTDILVGDLNVIEVMGDCKIATSKRPPMYGKGLDLLSYTVFGIMINAEVSYNYETKTIEVKKIDVRSR